MRDTNTNFDVKHALLSKTPAFIIAFDGETDIYCNHKPSDATASYFRYINKVSGLNQTIVPEKGRASIGGIKVSLVDYDGAITTLLSTDTYNFHRKKTTVKAGYKGLAIADHLAIGTGWITGLKLAPSGDTWEFDITDPQKWLQKKIFRNATEASPIIVSGNPINILLQALTSSDAGTNSDYDLGDSDLGCDLDSTTVDITGIEAVRNDWFWGDTHYMRFEITKEIKAKEFIENEILKVINCYPGIDGQGRYKVIPFKPPIATTEITQSFDEDNIIGLPKLDMNFAGVIHEIDFHIDWDGEDFDNKIYYVDATSFVNRGNAADPLTIKSKGLHNSMSPASIAGRANKIIERRKSSVFARYAHPPIKLTVSCYFSRWISEAGDIVDFTHSKMPDVATGTRGLSSERMEVVNRKVDWRNGKVTVDLLSTGFGKGIYSAASPAMTVASGSSATAFTVSAADAAKWTEGWEAQILDAAHRQIAASVTILTINTGTGAITCDSIGQTPQAGWLVVFADYDNCTAGQKLYGFVADTSNQLGTANDSAHLVAA